MATLTAFPNAFNAEAILFSEILSPFIAYASPFASSSQSNEISFYFMISFNTDSSEVVPAEREEQER